MSAIILAVTVKKNNHVNTNAIHHHLSYCFINDFRSLSFVDIEYRSSKNDRHEIFLSKGYSFVMGVPSVSSAIAVPVQALRVARIRHDGVGLDEAPEPGVIVAGVVKMQADGVVATLARNAPRARQPGPQGENAAIAPDAAGAAGEASGARAWALRWGDCGRRGGKTL